MAAMNVQPGRRALDAARRRYEGSLLESVAGRLQVFDFANWIVVFGASLLMTVLPLIILLSSLANERIDDDLSRHIGLNAQGAAIIKGLFRKAPTHSTGPIVLGLLIAFGGTVAVANSLQAIYERAFGQEARGWRDLPRYLAWTLALFGLLIAEGTYDGPVREAAGVVVRGIVSFVVVGAFFAWTIHFLLGGRVAWRAVISTALITALFWLGLAVFSSFYFSTAVITEHRLFGTLGVIFALLTWFIAIGAVILLGAACGTVWEHHAARPGAPGRA